MTDLQTAIAQTVAKLGTTLVTPPADSGGDDGPGEPGESSSGTSPGSSTPTAPQTTAPAIVTDGTTPALPGTTPGEPAIPSYDELGAVMAKRKAEREASEASDAAARELAELRAWKAEREKQPQQTGMDPAAFLADPWTVGKAAGYGPAEIRQILQKITRRVLSPDVAALEVEVAQLKAQPAAKLETPKELEARVAAMEAEREQERVTAIVAQYSAIASNPAMCETLPGLPADERVQWGDNVAARYQEAGYQLTMEQLALAADKAATEFYSKRAGVLGPVVPAAGKAGTNGAGAAPVSLTNDLQAAASEVPASFEDSIARAKRQHEDRARSANRSRRP